MRKARRLDSQPSRQVTISFRSGKWGPQHTVVMPRWSVRVLGLMVLCLFISGVYVSASYYQLRYDREHIQDIKDKNRQQQQQVKAMQDQLKALQDKQKLVIEEQKKLKKIMGLDPDKPLGGATPSRGGRGGPEPGDEIIPLSFSSHADELAEQLSISSWEDLKLEILYRQDPSRYRSLPIYWPVASINISSDYGERENPFGGEKSEVHHGVDLTGEVGYDVYAAGDGTVIYADWYPGYGRLIKIDHGNGLVSWYGHNYRLLVKVGDQVKRGQKIALMGSSGRSTGPHVHFAVQKDGEFVNPHNYLP